MKNILFLSILLFSSLAFASLGGDKGNGGLSVVCRDSSGEITSAELLDIYEGRLLYGRQYDSSWTADVLMNTARERIGDNTIYLKRFNKELEKINMNLIFIPYGNELEEINDAIPVIRKKGCKFEQLANYTNNGMVLVSQEIYDRLDTLNKVALFVHEAIYAIRRARGDEDSQISRQLTAHLLAVESDSIILQRFITGDHTTPCGLTGSVLERLSDCAAVMGGNVQQHFVPVSRTKTGEEFYLEAAAGIIWGPRLSENLSYFEAINRCENDFRALGLKWRLPGRADYARAELKGIRMAVIDTDQSFYWVNSGPSNYVFYKAENGRFGKGQMAFQLGVRCIATQNRRTN